MPEILVTTELQERRCLRHYGSKTGVEEKWGNERKPKLESLDQKVGDARISSAYARLDDIRTWIPTRCLEAALAAALPCSCFLCL